MLAILTGLGLGFLLGMRHALEPDHMAAVATLVMLPGGWRRGALVGAWWGVGHSAALLTVGAVLAILRTRMPTELGDLLELGVSVMLIGLGARNLARAFFDGKRGPKSTHAHGAHEHVHRGSIDHVHVGGVSLARRPLLVGMVHGLAGSGALTAIALAGMPSALAGLLYIALFGVGSVGGMALLTAAAGVPMRHAANSPRLQVVLTGLAGTSSLGLGILWGAPILERLIGL